MENRVEGGSSYCFESDIVIMEKNDYHKDYLGTRCIIIYYCNSNDRERIKNKRKVKKNLFPVPGTDSPSSLPLSLVLYSFFTCSCLPRFTHQSTGQRTALFYCLLLSTYFLIMETTLFITILYPSSPPLILILQCSLFLRGTRRKMCSSSRSIHAHLQPFLRANNVFYSLHFLTFAIFPSRPSYSLKKVYEIDLISRIQSEMLNEDEIADGLREME